jgi:hypothetical protein
MRKAVEDDPIDIDRLSTQAYRQRRSPQAE